MTCGCKPEFGCHLCVTLQIVGALQVCPVCTLGCVQQVLNKQTDLRSALGGKVAGLRRPISNQRGDGACSRGLAGWKSGMSRKSTALSQAMSQGSIVWSERTDLLLNHECRVNIQGGLVALEPSFKASAAGWHLVIVSSASGPAPTGGGGGTSGLSAQVVPVASQVAGGVAVQAVSWDVATTVGGWALASCGEVAKRRGRARAGSLYCWSRGRGGKAEWVTGPWATWHKADCWCGDTQRRGVIRASADGLAKNDHVAVGLWC
eukprot:464349-Amphidinium_carterae.3